MKDANNEYIINCLHINQYGLAFNLQKNACSDTRQFTL